MYLAELTISNFRKLGKVSLAFSPGLNVIVGPNNVGKTAIIDCLRALLSGQDELPLKLFDEDIHSPKDGGPAGQILFHYTFRGLSADDEADFLHALVPNKSGQFEAQIHIRYSDPDESSGRLKIRRWCGPHEENGLTPEMMENLRGVYLPPLRDASLGLRPSRSSKLAGLLRLLADETGRSKINDVLKEFDAELKTHRPIVDTEAAIKVRHNSMLGEQLSQSLEVGLSVSDFQRLTSRLSLTVDSFDIERNGLGFNNLIFMAVVLSELSKNPAPSFRGLIVEEPEAHLHPQLQAVLLRYLEKIKAEKTGGQTAEGGVEASSGEAESTGTQNSTQGRPVQVFVTSHSPHFSSIAKLESLVCLFETEKGVNCFSPRSIPFRDGKQEKLERYLDVTRAELFFARRVIFVEGAAELILVSVLAQKCGFDLRDHGVSLISVEGLNFDCFLPLFGERSIEIPVAVITDADPKSDVAEASGASYPSLDDKVQVSDNTAAMLKAQDKLVQVFHGKKTFEYDLALFEENRGAMIKTLKGLHPQIGAKVEEQVTAAPDNTSKAKALFCGMFERPSNNVQKGRFGQALAQTFMENGVECQVPDYIKRAVAHACRGTQAGT